MKKSSFHKHNNFSCSIVDGARDQFPSKKHDRIVFHLCIAPMALLCFIGTFAFTCAVIPTVGQLLFCLAVMCLSVFIIERCGRQLYPTLKELEANAIHKTMTKELLGYYAIFLIIVLLTMVSGSYLNTHYLDEDKAVQNQTHFERIFIINNN